MPQTGEVGSFLCQLDLNLRKWYRMNMSEPNEGVKKWVMLPLYQKLTKWNYLQLIAEKLWKAKPLVFLRKVRTTRFSKKQWRPCKSDRSITYPIECVRRSFTLSEGHKSTGKEWRKHEATVQNLKRKHFWLKPADIWAFTTTSKGFEALY